MDWTSIQDRTETFALGHACLGCLLAAAAAILLRRHSPALRCWVWRCGLLKGPLALMLAVPVAILEPKVAAIPAAGVPESIPVSLTDLGPIVVAAAEPINPWPYLYVLGVLAALIYRFGGHPRTDPRMPRVEGLLRPRVIVPDDLAPNVAEMALAHEKAHLRRRDPQWSLVADLVCAAFWFAPPVWFCARAMRAEAEAACDAEALRETGAAKRAYADLLLSFAGPAPANALSGPARRLSRRILMLEKTPKYLPRLSTAALIATGLFTLVPWRAEAQSRPTAPAKPIVTKAPQTANAAENLRKLKAEEAAMKAQVAKVRAELAQLRAQSSLLRAQKESMRRDGDRQKATAERLAVERAMLRIRQESLRDADAQVKRAAAEMVQARAHSAKSEMARIEMERRADQAQILRELKVAREQMALDRYRAARDVKVARKRLELDRKANQTQVDQETKRMRQKAEADRVRAGTPEALEYRATSIIVQHSDGKQTTLLKGDVKLEGKSLDDLPTPANPSDPLKVWILGDYTTRLYREGTAAPFTYRIERTVTKDEKRGG